MTSVPLVGKLTAPLPPSCLSTPREVAVLHITDRKREARRTRLAFGRARSCFSVLPARRSTFWLTPYPGPLLLIVNWEALLIPSPSQASAQGATRHHPPWQIRLSGGHLAGELLLLQLEKDNGGPWQRTWFWGVFHRDTWWKTKAAPHPSCWHSAEASWGILQCSWLQPQLELHTVLLTLPLWTSSIP